METRWSVHELSMKTQDRIPDSKVHGTNMGPIWGRQDPGGPHVGPMNFAIWNLYKHNYVHGYHRLIRWEMMIIIEWKYAKIASWICHGIIYSNDYRDNNNDNDNDDDSHDDNNDNSSNNDNDNSLVIMIMTLLLLTLGCQPDEPLWLPARWASDFSGDHQQNHQCLWFHSCYNFTRVFCPSYFLFYWE